MSTISGRNPALWNLFDQIVEDVRSFRNMRLLVACRKYDLDNDHRLRRIVANGALCEQVTVAPLEVAQVREALKTAGFNAGSLSDSQIELLRVPFHLMLFLDTLPSNDYGFSAISELYDKYWDRKRRSVTQRLGRDCNWLPLVDALTNHLSTHQVLAAPRKVVEPWRDDADAMVSEHFLVRDGANYLFSQESFFDYSFARRFVDNGGDVLAMLLESEQHLFRRAQVRQILTYAREHDWDEYLRSLDRILFHPRVRFHLKKVVLSGFSQIARPRKEEWKVVEKARNDGQCSAHVDLHIRDHLGWFDLLDEMGMWQQWLADPDDVCVDRTCWLLTAPIVMEKRSLRVATLFGAYKGKGDDWNKRLRYVMSWGWSHHSREMFDLFLDLIRDGTLDEERTEHRREWWTMLHEMSDKAPEYASEAVGCWMDRRLTALSGKDVEDPFGVAGQGGQIAEEVISTAAAKSPESFVRYVLPAAVKCVQRTALPANDGQRRDRIWFVRSFRLRIGIGANILLGLKNALERMANENPKRLDEFTAPLEELDFDTLEFLLVSAWSANPDRYYEKCARYILVDSHRLGIGYSHCSDGNGAAAVTRLAIRGITARCDATTLADLENAILGYFPNIEKQTPKLRGYSQYLLLTSIDKSRRSQRVSSRIEELSQKFPEITTTLSTQGSREDDCVTSPIPPSKTRLMSDKQWVSAMQRYSHDREEYVEGWLKGGSYELSRVLELDTRRDRSRFSNLALTMPANLNPRYFSAILNGLCRSGASSIPEDEREKDKADLEAFGTDILADVIRRLHDLPGRPVGAEICRGIQSLAGRPWQNDILSIVSWYAANDPDPKSDKFNTKAGGRPSDDRGDPEFKGMNSVRGSAANAISSLMFADSLRIPKFDAAITSLVRDKSLAVRCCAIGTLFPILKHDRDKAVSLFSTLVQDVPEIVETDRFESFVHYAAPTHYAQLRPLLLNALKSHGEKAIAGAARRICVASFAIDKAREDAEQVMKGSIPMRKAAAEIYSANFKEQSLSSQCAEQLRQLFVDVDAGVRDECEICFADVAGELLVTHKQLVSDFIESPAYPKGSYHLLRSLNESVDELPDVICRAAERFINEAGTDGADISTSASLGANTLSTLVVRLYGQTTDEEVKSHCLDLIDRMEAMAYVGIDRELRAIDR
ncbi:MAG: hypothetical protein IH991_11425 [Planctomycetes bacterium]|nr:hypothetical protein [Planctomycetota bacterium]